MGSPTNLPSTLLEPVEYRPVTTGSRSPWSPNEKSGSSLTRIRHWSSVLRFPPFVGDRPEGLTIRYVE